MCRIKIYTYKEYNAREIKETLSLILICDSQNIYILSEIFNDL